jgi:hypothetical protein
MVHTFLLSYSEVYNMHFLCDNFFRITMSEYYGTYFYIIVFSSA